MHVPPTDPDPRLLPFTPADLRPDAVFGAPVLLMHLPSRKARQDRADGPRPAFRQSPAPRICGEEALWQGGGLVLTPNRYPFAREQRILWPAEPRREPDAGMWHAICAWAERARGTALLNNVGAAASIARAHAHLTPERLPFLDALPEQLAPAGLIAVPDGVTLVQKDLPCCLLGVRGPAAAIATAIVRLGEARLTAAWNVVVTGGAAWCYPRSVETPAPHFPYPIGAAEVWGRWCYVDAEPYAVATGRDLEQALVAGGCPRL